jgi:hypothetical protein
MSLVKIQGNASGTGEFTIAAPNSNTNRVLTLPDVTGTIALQGGSGVGKVLQSVTASFTTLSTSSTSTGTSAPEWGSVTITPTTSGNYLLAIVSGVCAIQTACLAESRAYITYAATGVSEAIAQQNKSGNETSSLRTTDSFGMVTRITTATTNTYTIRVRANGVDVGGTGRSTEWQFGQIVVLEIAT